MAKGLEFQFQRQSFQRIFRTDYSWNQRGGPKSADLECISASFTDLRLGLGQRDRYQKKKKSKVKRGIGKEHSVYSKEKPGEEEEGKLLESTQLDVAAEASHPSLSRVESPTH